MAEALTREDCDLRLRLRSSEYISRMQALMEDFYKAHVDDWFALLNTACNQYRGGGRPVEGEVDALLEMIQKLGADLGEASFRTALEVVFDD